MRRVLKIFMKNMFVMRHAVEGLAWWVVVMVALVGGARGLQPLAAGEDNDILTAEDRLRATTNTLFTLLRLRGAKDRPRLQQYSLVHNYFITLTLQDYNSLREIAKITRVDKENIGNVMTDFITLLNDILKEEQALKSKSTSIIGEGFDVHAELEKLEYLKRYHDPGYVTDINSEILKQLYKITRTAEIQPYNITSTTTEAPLLDPNQILTSDVTRSILKLLEENYFRLDFDGTDTLRTVDTSMYLHNDTIPHEKALWRLDDVFPSGRRIYNGKKTKIKHFPFMASVQIFNKFQCAGSIIKNDLVVTAASCLQLAWNNRFYRENPSFLTVRVGSSFYEGGGDNIPVLEIYFYPSYNPRNLHNNLAVMRLHRKVKWHKNVKKIPLDTEEHSLPDNTNEVIVVGWGARSASNVMHNAFTDKIQYSVLNFYPLRDCQEIYSKEYVTIKNFCAGYISFGSGACNRDVGGPGIISGMLAGIISFGAPVCGTPDAPTVFTKVGFYYDWIEEIMEQDVPETKAKTTLKPISDYPKPTSQDYKTKWTIQPVPLASELEIPPLGAAHNLSIREDYDKDDDDDDNKNNDKQESSAENQDDMKNILSKIYIGDRQAKVEGNQTKEELRQITNASITNEKEDDGAFRSTRLGIDPTELTTTKYNTDSVINVISITTKVSKIKHLSLEDIARTSDVKTDDEKEINDAQKRELIRHYKQLIKDVKKKLPTKHLESQKHDKLPNAKHKKIIPKHSSKAVHNSTSRVQKKHDNKMIKSTPNLKHKVITKKSEMHKDIKRQKQHSAKTKGTTKTTEKKHKHTTEAPKKHTPAGIVEEKIEVQEEKEAQESDSDNYESKSEEVFTVEIPSKVHVKSPSKTTKKERKIKKQIRIEAITTTPHINKRVPKKITPSRTNAIQTTTHINKKVSKKKAPFKTNAIKPTTRFIKKVSKKKIPSGSDAIKTTIHIQDKDKRVAFTYKPIKKITKRPTIIPLKSNILIKNKKPLDPLEAERNLSRILPDGDTSYDDLDFPKIPPKTDSMEANETHAMTSNDTIFEDYKEVAPKLNIELERLKNNIKHLISDAETSKEEDGFQTLMIETNDTKTIVEHVYVSNEDPKQIIREGLPPINIDNNEANNFSTKPTTKIQRIILKHHSPKRKHKQQIKAEETTEPVTQLEEETTTLTEEVTGNDNDDVDLSAPRQENVPNAIDVIVSSEQTETNSSSANSKEEEIQQMMENNAEEKELRARAQPSPDSNTSDDVILAKSSTESQETSEEKNLLNYINLN